MRDKLSTVCKATSLIKARILHDLHKPRTKWRMWSELNVEKLNRWRFLKVSEM